MPTPYEKIYSSLLAKFTDYNIPLMDDEDVIDELSVYLDSAIVKFHVCKKDLSLRNNEKKTFEEELSEMEIEIISSYMLIEYLDANYIKTPSLLKVALGSKDFQAYSPANMLEKLLELHRTCLKENEALLSRYAWLGIKEEGKEYPIGKKIIKDKFY